MTNYDPRFYCSCGLSFPNAERINAHLDVTGYHHKAVDPPPVVSFGYLPDWLIRYDSIRRERA